MALVVALVGLVVIGALVATAFHAAHLEHRAGHNAVYATRALDAAEAGAAAVLGEWDAHPEFTGLAVGERVTLAGAALGNRAVFQPTVVRLNEAVYLVQSEGTSLDALGNALARRLVAILARRTPTGVAPLTQRSWFALY